MQMAETALIQAQMESQQFTESFSLFIQQALEFLAIPCQSAGSGRLATTT